MVRMAGITGHDPAGCSKRSSSKAAPSEGPRRCTPHFVWADPPLNWPSRLDPPFSPSDLRESSQYGEGLKDSSTMPPDYFSILPALVLNLTFHIPICRRIRPIS